MVKLQVIFWNRSSFGIKLLDHFPFTDYGNKHVLWEGNLTCQPNDKAHFILDGVKGWLCKGGVACSFSFEFSDGSQLKFDVKVPAMGASAFYVFSNGLRHSGVAITWSGYSNTVEMYHVMLEITNGGHQLADSTIPDS